MKFQKYGKRIPKLLDNEVEIQPYDFALKSPMKRLNYLLGLIKEKEPSSFSKYIKNLELKFKSLINEDILSKKDLNFNEFLIDFDVLKEYPELAKYSLNYFLQILQLPEKDDWIKEKVKVLNKNYLRSFLIPKYYNLQTLSETIGREEAIQLYKFYVTKFINDDLSPKRKIFDTLEAFKEYFEMDKKQITIGWYGLLSEVKDGKFFFRKDNCLWAEVLMDLPDNELKYLICCYGDFQAALTRSNNNFILTMKHTIVEGDSYCDCIIHDTSIDWDLTHPSSEFWDNLESID
ncbi:MAG: L-2-amino-thiazoline-4-carboxylic acid hydrolase [Candidatus Hermodarchaeota archaeon]